MAIVKQTTRKQRADAEKNRRPPRFLLGREKGFIAEHLSMLLAAGIDLSTTMRTLEMEISSKPLRKVITDMREQLESGSSLWKALDGSRLFTPQAVSLVRIGESAGRLAEYLQLVAEQQAKDRMFRARVRSAATYPVLVLVVAFIVGLGIAWFILPRLATVFSSLHINLPLTTRILIALGVFLGKYGSIVVPLLFVTVPLLVYIIFFASRTKFIGQAIVLHTPGIRRLVQEVELARFGFILGTLLGAGLPLTDSLEALSRSADMQRYKHIYKTMMNGIEEGDSFNVIFKEHPDFGSLLPTIVEQMVISGEDSGRLAETLKKIGDTYEVKADITTKNLTVLLEPILLVTVWMGVMVIALSVILPIYQLVGSFSA